MKPTLHIQHVLLSLQPGGLENGVVNVVNRLNPGKFRSSLCCLKQAGEFASRVTAPHTEIHELGWRGGNDLMLPIRLARLFRQTKPDIVHTRNAESFLYGYLGAKLAGIKCLIHSEHGRIFDDRQIRFWVQKWFSKNTQAIFSVSAQLKQDLVKYINIPEGNIAVLHNGVDLGRFKPVQREALQESLGLKQNQLVIGSVGRLVAVKNYALLLKAFGTLDMPNAVIVLVGEGPERSALEELARTLHIADRVRFLGHRDDVVDLLRVMDIFVLPSLSEGMSNTLLEAMAVGVVPIASAVGGNAEIVNHSVDGFIFPSGDEATLGGQLKQLSMDVTLRTLMASQASEKVKNKFTIEAMIARYERLYQQVWLKHGEQR